MMRTTQAIESSTTDADADDREPRWLRVRREVLGAASSEASVETSLGVLVRATTDWLGADTRAAFYRADAGGTSLHHRVGMPEGYAKAVDGLRRS